MNSEEVILRGERASRLLGDETLTAVLKEIEDECSAAWLGSNPTDAAGREDQYRMVRCVGLVRQKLETWRGAASVEKDNAKRRLNEAR